MKKYWSWASERLVGFFTYNDYLVIELLVIFFLTAVILFANV
jgi:hypothetical protein